MKNIPDQPTQERARATAQYLFANLLKDFPIEKDSASLANLCAAILTPLVRQAVVGNVPLCGITAPVREREKHHRATRLDPGARLSCGHDSVSKGRR
jgi:hypothetical protein